MPNISAHLIVAKEIGKKLNLNNDDFIRGNLLPDVIDEKDSHQKFKKGVYMVPNINLCLKKLDLNNDMDIGYLIHLLLDKHFLEDYLGTLYPNKNIFSDGKIYEDYDYLNYKLVTEFNLDLDYLNRILCTYNCKILGKKLLYNIECINQKKVGNIKYLNFESFSMFLSEISDFIIKELINYANESSKLRLYIR